MSGFGDVPMASAPEAMQCVAAPVNPLEPIVPTWGDIEAQAHKTREAVVKAKHSHYYKDVARLDFVDVYRVLLLFNVTDPCLQHAIKKLLVAGGRGAGKDICKDVEEARDSLARFLEMRDEESPEYLLK